VPRSQAAAYDESLVNTALVLPSVVTAIVIVVQRSLALAFSLTGIVAAVRFRTNLKDSRDALYIFAGVAIGFATGVHEPEGAAAASLLFVLLELFAWRSGLGGHRTPAQAALRSGSLDAAAPSQTRLSSGTLGHRSLRSSTPNGGHTIVLEYECRLRRAYTPDSVRGQVLRQGVPFVRAVGWDR